MTPEIAAHAAAVAETAPPLTPGQIASLATLLATASAPHSAAVTTSANRPSGTTKDEERHVTP